MQPWCLHGGFIGGEPICDPLPLAGPQPVQTPVAEAEEVAENTGRRLLSGAAVHVPHAP